MKKSKKILLVVLAIAMLAVVLVSATACGSKAAALTGIYNSGKQITYQNFSPNYNFRIMTITNQSIETYDDGTYCLTVTSVGYSNVTFGENIPSAEFTANEKGTATTRFYGKLTVKDATADDATYVLGKPTRVVSSKQGNAYIDTANWTEAMAEATRPTDPQTGSKGDALDKDAYLASQLKAWESGDIEVYMILSNSSFSFIEAITNAGNVIS